MSSVCKAARLLKKLESYFFGQDWNHYSSDDKKKLTNWVFKTILKLHSTQTVQIKNRKCSNWK